MIYCIDIDGCICTNTWGDYTHARPYTAVIEMVRRLYESGHTIILHTARGAKSGMDWRPTTERQLDNWGVPYHELHMGKPYADFYVDDRALPLMTFLHG